MGSKEQMFAKVVLASKPSNGAPPIITIHARYPRIIHSELMTHRVFSRNARSSRAVPVKTMLEEVRNAPFIPWHWGKNQKGMQAGEEWNGLISAPTFSGGCEDLTREEAWLRARDWAVTIADGYADAGYHKQIANRLLEPFMFIDTLITSTSWANFMHLRDHKDAEPHIRDLAILVKAAIADADYRGLKPGQWHLPYITGEDREIVRERVGSREGSTEKFWALLQKLSVARCARISYAPFDGDASIERELERYELLVGSDPLHASPAEHQATPDSHSERELMMAKYGGWEPNDWQNPHLAGNLGPGWIQYRKTLPGEYVADAA